MGISPLLVVFIGKYYNKIVDNSCISYGINGYLHFSTGPTKTTNYYIYLFSG